MAEPEAARAVASDAAFACPPISAPGYCGDDGPALKAGLGAPTDVAVRPGGGYLVADATNDAIRLVVRGRIVTVARRVRLRFPAGVAPLGDGSMLIADTGGDRVLRVHPGSRARRITKAPLNRPLSIAPAAHGGVLVADTGNNRILLVRRNGSVATVAGTGAPGAGGDGGPAVRASLDRPTRVVATPDGGFVAATADGRVRRVGPDGTIEAVVGPFGGAPAIALGADGSLLVADPVSRDVTRVSLDGSASTLVASGACPSLGHPAALAATRDGGVLIADSGARRILMARGGRIGPIAGAGLRVPTDACDDTAAPVERLDLLPPARGTPDYIYNPPPPTGGGPGPPPSGDDPRRRCTPRSRWQFTLRRLYLRQARHVVKRPSSRRGFQIYLYVSARARLVLTARRAGRQRWRYPRRGLSRPRGGRVRVNVRRLRPGTYRLVMQAEALNQRICRTLSLKVRR